MVEKLFPAMKAVKQAGGMEAMANRKNMAVAMKPPMPEMTASKLKPGHAGSEPVAPATDSSGSPPAIRIASVTATSPPQRTSRASRLFMPKSAPAAPAVAKKPMTIWISSMKPM